MRCLYREKIFECGKYMEVDIYPVFEKQRCRGKKRKPTSETQQLLNQRNAERKLIRLLNTNFTEKDIRFDLTYNDEHLPDFPERAQKNMQNFLRRVKRYRIKHGLPELRYVAVTEAGEENGRPHHHIVMDGDISITTLAEIWGKGYTTAKPLQFDEFGITGIAVYLVKSPILGKRWCASRNLKQPKERSRDGMIPKYRVKELHDFGADCREYIEKTYEGYALSDCQSFQNEVNTGYYIAIRLCKKSAPKRARKRG